MTDHSTEPDPIEQTAQDIAAALGVPAAHWPLMAAENQDRYRNAAKCALQNRHYGISPAAQAALPDTGTVKKIIKELLDELWEDRHSYSSSEEPFKKEFSEAVALCSWKSRHE